MGCGGLAPGFGNGAAKNAGRDGDDLEYDPVGLGEERGRGLVGMKWWRGVGAAAAGEGSVECGEGEGTGGSYHRPVFGEERVFLIDLAAMGLSYEGAGYVLLV